MRETSVQSTRNSVGAAESSNSDYGFGIDLAVNKNAEDYATDTEESVTLYYKGQWRLMLDVNCGFYCTLELSFPFCIHLR